MQRLVYGANADVMLTLRLIALYSTGGKVGDACTWCGGKCNAMLKLSLGNAGRPVDEVR